MIHDPFDSNNDRLSMSDAMMGNPRAEMRYGRISSFNDDSVADQMRRSEAAVSFGFIDYILNGSISLRRRVRNAVLWLMTVAALTVLVSVAMTKLAG